jgi:hypothetical protein
MSTFLNGERTGGTVNASGPAQQILPPGRLSPRQADNRPNRRLDLQVRVVDDETLILDWAAGFIHRLNPTAGYIWERCDGQFTPAEIAHHLAETFDVPVKTAAADVAITLEQLYRSNLLAPCEGLIRYGGSSP